MSFAELMRFLLDHDVQIRPDGQVLHYDAPDGVMTDQVRMRLRDHKPALLSWLDEHDPRRRPVSRALPPYIQQEWWHRARSSPCPAVYNLAQRLHFEGRFDPAALESALNRLAARHEPLRTRFTSYRDTDGDQPVQEVLDHRPFRLTVTDLTATSGQDRDAVLDRYCGQIVNRPFPLDRAPLWRARLFVLGPRHHVLLWTVHHIICDGWSMGILLDELVEAYEAATRSGEAPRPMSPAPDPASGPAPGGPSHADYARWQRRDLTGARLDRLTTFWRAELAGASMPLALPYDRTAPARPSGRGAAHDFAISHATLARLRAVASDLRTTTYATVLGTYALLLSEFTGQDDLVIPISHANRTRREHEAIVGLIADRLPIRITLTGTPTIADLVGRVGRTVFNAVDHALPLSLLVASLPVAQRPPAPYPAALFTLRDTSRRVREPPGVDVHVESDSAADVARMPLYCYMTIAQDGLRGAFEYSTELFDVRTVTGLADRFGALLDTVATDPDHPVDKIRSTSGTMTRTETDTETGTDARTGPGSGVR